MIDHAWLRDRLATKRRRLALLLSLFLISYSVAMAVPVVFQRAIDMALSANASSAKLAIAAFAIAALFGVGAAVSYAATRIQCELRIFLESRINRRLLLSVLARESGDKAGSGEALTIFRKSAELSYFLLDLFPKYVLDIGKASLCWGLLVAYNWPIAVAVLLVTGIATVAIGRLLGNFEKLQADVIAAEIASENDLSETLTGLSTIRTQSLQAMRYKSFGAKLVSRAAATRRLNAMTNRFGLGMSLASSGISVVLLAFGGYQLMAGRLSVGELVAAQILVGNIVVPLLTSGDLLTKISEMRATMLAVASFSAGVRAPAAGTLRRNPDFAAIRLKNVSVAYHPGAPVLEGIDLEFPPRGVVAIVGRNGSGKTTLLRTLLGIVKPSRGAIAVDGVSLERFHPRRVPRSVGVVEQDSVLFSGSIAENIARRTAGFAAARLNVVARWAGIQELVAKDIAVQPGGLNLSGGQRQRIAHARALYRDPGVFMLDEPTSFLDADAARRMEAHVMELARDRLVLLATHNMALAARADRIVVLAGGKVAGIGNHEKLMRDCEAYRFLQHKPAAMDLPSDALPI